jgi:hypothetical protein
VSEEERDILAEDFLEIGNVPVILQLITGRTWTRSERIDLDAAQLSALGKARGGGDPSIRPKTGWMALTVIDGDLATFDSILEVVREDKEMKIASTITSTVDVEIRTGRLRSIITTGTLKGELRGKKKAPVEGTLKSKLTLAY